MGLTSSAFSWEARSNHALLFELDVCKHYSNEVRDWDALPAADGSRAAALATGLCERCAVSLAKVDNDDALRGVAAFS